MTDIRIRIRKHILTTFHRTLKINQNIWHTHVCVDCRRHLIFNHMECVIWLCNPWNIVDAIKARRLYFRHAFVMLCMVAFSGNYILNVACQFDKKKMKKKNYGKMSKTPDDSSTFSHCVSFYVIILKIILNNQSKSKLCIHYSCTNNN